MNFYIKSLLLAQVCSMAFVWLGICADHVFSSFSLLQY